MSVIELPDEAGGGVARIGEDLQSLLRLLGVELGEIRVPHVDLAAHLEDAGEILGDDRLGNVANGADIGRDVLALIAVAARRALNQFAALIAVNWS